MGGGSQGRQADLFIRILPAKNGSGMIAAIEFLHMACADWNEQGIQNLYERKFQCCSLGPTKTAS